jgi:hypothetical protein
MGSGAREHDAADRRVDGESVKDEGEAFEDAGVLFRGVE